jgi:hypothetical protein
VHGGHIPYSRRPKGIISNTWCASLCPCGGHFWAGYGSNWALGLEEKLLITGYSTRLLKGSSSLGLCNNG